MKRIVLLVAVAACLGFVGCGDDAGNGGGGEGGSAPGGAGGGSGGSGGTGGTAVVCNNDGSCDAGETNANCVADCPICNNDGSCDAGETNANCVADCPASTCDNDGSCEAGETTDTCPGDCPAAVCNNDGSCDAGETTANCPADCPAPVCNDDGTCDAGETTANCPADCPAAACNNDGSCDAGETTANCPADCPAAACNNDGSCDAGETTASCPADCPAPVCNNDGSCDAGETTVNCPADCPAPVCNFDGVCDAGETAANCPSDCTVPVCNNDGSCDAGETTANCPADCPAPVCDNDGSCDAGETTANCPADCPAPVCDNDGSCDAGETTANCPADCPAPVCGDSIVDAPETCDDGNLVDGDGCSSTCSLEVVVGDDCTAPGTATYDAIAGTVTVSGDTTGVGADIAQASCAPSGDSGDLVYSFTSPFAARWDFALTATFDAVIAVQAACGDDLTDLDCDDIFGAGGETLSVTLASGETVTLLVDGYGNFGPEEGTFTLTGTPTMIVGLGGACDPAGVTSLCDTGLFCNAGFCSAVVCGDGNVGPGEGCDDANLVDGDGCDSNCSVTACGNGIVTGSEICDDANVVDGDGCDSNCTVTGCGNGIITAGESCEPPGVGTCDAACQIAGATGEIEPNEDGTPSTGGTGTTGNDFDATAVANADANGAYSADAMIAAALNPAGDEDVFAITNPGPNPVIVRLEIFVGSVGACVGFDSALRVRDAAGVSLAQDDDSGVNACSLITAYTLAPGATAYVHVSEYGDNDVQADYLLSMTFTPVFCGDGIVVAPAEQCDDANATDGDGCDNNCTATACGNGVVTAGESCDDSNVVSGDGCDSNCTATACGNGVVTVGEQCDDGNVVNGDNCDSACQFEVSPLVAALGVCPGTVVTVTGTPLPGAIADNAETLVTFMIPNVGNVVSVAVGFSATHTFDGDLDISLISPSATSIDVSSDNGGGGDNFTSTIFADSAAASVVGSVAPFTGNFRPEVAFSTLAGQAAAGSWTLRVFDDAGGDTGSVTDATLAICLQ